MKLLWFCLLWIPVLYQNRQYLRNIDHHFSCFKRNDSKSEVLCIKYAFTVLQRLTKLWTLVCSLVLPYLKCFFECHAWNWKLMRSPTLGNVVFRYIILICSSQERKFYKITQIDFFGAGKNSLLYTLSVKRNLSLLQNDIHRNPHHQNVSYLDTDYPL